eukprot:TRINITY_DN23018_c0_g5_i1.p1 TRINITY_DN23018_c0_g5~~TRINITY_DN23018_c0_g5_i1.p1  ORF type:complete len:214 (-),score=40.03 TRINITY_DN23018_c0_g5_i1:358-999(-)
MRCTFSSMSAASSESSSDVDEWLAESLSVEAAAAERNMRLASTMQPHLLSTRTTMTAAPVMAAPAAADVPLPTGLIAAVENDGAKRVVRATILQLEGLLATLLASRYSMVYGQQQDEQCVGTWTPPAVGSTGLVEEQASSNCSTRVTADVGSRVQVLDIHANLLGKGGVLPSRDPAVAKGPTEAADRSSSTVDKRKLHWQIEPPWAPESDIQL